MRVQGREALDKADIPSNPNNRTTMSKTAKFLQYILDSKHKSTFKQYKISVKLFTTYYNESNETNLTSDDFIEKRKQDFLSEDVDQQRRFHREIEKFHKWMIDGSKTREPYAINSARNMTLGMIQLFKYSFICRNQFSYINKYPHYTDIYQNSSFTIKNARKHRYSLFGESIRQITPATPT
jgi:hypothetical protein